MNREIFHLSTDDASGLARLHAEADADPWGETAFLDLLAQPSGFGLGLACEGELIAFLLVQIAAENADVLQIATHPDHRRAGHARALLSALETQLRLRGITRLTLDVAADNTPARAFYQDAGFTQDGRRPRYYTARRVAPSDAILMSKPL
jgi:[ribosomal protein S18]-alanine N-acetyltransferase